MELTQEQRRKYNEDQKKANEVLGELGGPSKERRDILIERFGGVEIFTTYTIAQLVVGFRDNRALTDAFRDCPDKSNVLAMVGAISEIGYAIAEERYEQQVKVLEAKLMIAEEELKKAKEVGK